MPPPPFARIRNFSVAPSSGKCSQDGGRESSQSIHTAAAESPRHECAKAMQQVLSATNVQAAAVHGDWSMYKFYVNTKTKATQWIRPLEFAPNARNQLKQPQLRKPATQETPAAQTTDTQARDQTCTTRLDEVCHGAPNYHLPPPCFCVVCINLFALLRRRCRAEQGDSNPSAHSRKVFALVDSCWYGALGDETRRDTSVVPPHRYCATVTFGSDKQYQGTPPTCCKRPYLASCIYGHRHRSFWNHTWTPWRHRNKAIDEQQWTAIYFLQYALVGTIAILHIVNTTSRTIRKTLQVLRCGYPRHSRSIQRQFLNRKNRSG